MVSFRVAQDTWPSTRKGGDDDCFEVSDIQCDGCYVRNRDAAIGNVLTDLPSWNDAVQDLTEDRLQPCFTTH